MSARSGGSSRAKRPSEDLPSRYDDDNGRPSNKRVRFDARNPSTLATDAADEDPVLDIDEFGKRGPQSKRNAVNLEGYESDSDNDNFDRRAAAKAKAEKDAKTKAAAEEDMFADSDPKDGDDDEDFMGKAKSKTPRFLDEDEIEGQDRTSKAGGHVGEDMEYESSSESGDDEERDRMPSDLDEELGAGAKKKHAPRLDAFNMRSENVEGRFDEHGNYVRNASDPNAKYDEWLDGVSKKDMKKAAEAKARQDEEHRKKAMIRDAVLTSQHLKTLITYLRPAETPLEAIARLGKAQRKVQKSLLEQEISLSKIGVGKHPRSVKFDKYIETITEAVSQLIERGSANAYHDERERFKRRYKDETGEDWVDKPEMWEFRWADARDGGSTHGPYEASTMRAWMDQAFFNDDAAEFRRVGEEEWSYDADF